MRKLTTGFGLVIALLLGSAVASASPILNDWVFAIGVGSLFDDSLVATASQNTTIPLAINGLNPALGGFFPGLTISAGAFAAPGSSFDTTGGATPSGLGDILVQVHNNTGSAESVTLDGYFKYSFSDNNDGFFGDYASTLGTTGLGENYYLLDYDNALAQGDPLAYLASLNGTNTNQVPTPDPYQPDGGTPCCDVLLGLGLNVNIPAGGIGYFPFLIRYSDNGGGYQPLTSGSFFYDVQKGPVNGETIFLFAPEPSGLVFMLAGLFLIIAASAFGKHRRRSRATTR